MYYLWRIWFDLRFLIWCCQGPPITSKYIGKMSPETYDALRKRWMDSCSEMPRKGATRNA